MKQKVLVIAKSLLWCLVILLFPVISGTLSVILSLDTVTSLFLQGAFMILALLPPAFFVLKGKWDWSACEFTGIDLEGCKRALYFLPLLVIFIPPAMKGFYVKSAGYVLGSLFLYLFVGIAEEVYFRGIIPRYLKEVFSTRGLVLLSAVIFAVGHIAAALAGSTAFEIALTVLNAFIFGWLAMEMTILSSSIIPATLVHFLFDFETKITVMNGSELLDAEVVRGILMFILAGWLATVIYKERAEFQ